MRAAEPDSLFAHSLTRRQAATSLAFLLPWVLAGCAAKPKPGEPPAPPSSGGMLDIFKASIASIGGDIVGSADLNLSANNRPSPLPLRVYELRADTAFNKADFLALYQSDAATLGAEMLAREEIVLAPSETKLVARVLNPDTRFLAVFGAYRQFERAAWRAIAPVTVGKKQTMQIRAASLAVSIQLKVV